MSTNRKIATIAVLATIIAAPAHAAPPVKHVQSQVLAAPYASPYEPGRTTGPTSGRSWRLEGQLLSPDLISEE